MRDVPPTMQAVVLDRFGGPEVLELREVPAPVAGPGEVVLRLAVAGVGAWDPFEREGGYAEVAGIPPSFPYVLGSEGAGTVVAVGAGVDDLAAGEEAYAASFLNPAGGFYAQYVAVPADRCRPVPPRLTPAQAGVMAGVGTTALRGLDDVLGTTVDHAVAVVGASGAMGHLAVQLARALGARVLAVASGPDGVALVEELGADVAVDGRGGDVAAAAARLTPAGLDAALVTVGGPTADEVVAAVRPGGRVVVPTGVEPVPGEPPGVSVELFNGDPDTELLDRFDELVRAGPLDVRVHATFPLADAGRAHEALGRHHLGKLALRIP